MDDPSLRLELSVHPDLVLDDEALLQKACRAAGVERSTVRGLDILRRSVDSRRRSPKIQLVVEFLYDADQVGKTSSQPPHQPHALPTLTGEPSVIIVGAGPAGLFCALALAERGIRATVVDRGQPVAQRRHDVAALSQRGDLNLDSNYCFGEGGAGTFSDGKLYTRSKKRGLTGTVLEALVAYGAPRDILIDARPHIGTNRLPNVITRLREHLQDAGQVIVFGRRVVGLVSSASQVHGVHLDDGSTLQAPAVVLATGHSAKNVYRFVADAGVALSGKAFAMGVRVEHAQAFVDQTQYGQLAGHPALGSASYRLVERAGDRAVFSFCMCPGGFIVPAATDDGQQVVNGWSPKSRRGRYANSGLVVEVGPETLAAEGFSPDDPFSGLRYQQALEKRAFAAGGGRFVAPAQRLSDFLSGTPSTALPPTSYPCGTTAASLDGVLGGLAAPLRHAVSNINQKMPGFAGHDAIAVGVESRTSSTLRIERDSSTLQSVSHTGLYPAAEGAGYAGGIMSAALDGIRIAEAIAQQARTVGS